MKHKNIVISIIIIVIISLVFGLSFYIYYNSQYRSKGFSPTIVDLDNEQVYNIDNTTRISNLFFLGSNKYPELDITSENKIIAMPDKPIPKNTVVLRQKHNKDIVENGLGTIMLGGISQQDNQYFEQSNLVYLLIYNIENYDICGFRIGMSLKEIKKAFGENIEINVDEFGVTIVSFTTTHKDCVYNIVVDVEDDIVTKIVLNINNTEIFPITEEENQQFLKDLYGEDAIIEDSYDPNSPDYPGYPPE